VCGLRGKSKLHPTANGNCVGDELACKGRRDRTKPSRDLGGQGSFPYPLRPRNSEKVKVWSQNGKNYSRQSITNGWGGAKKRKHRTGRYVLKGSPRRVHRKGGPAACTLVRGCTCKKNNTFKEVMRNATYELHRNTKKREKRSKT